MHKQAYHAFNKAKISKALEGADRTPTTQVEPEYPALLASLMLISGGFLQDQPVERPRASSECTIRHYIVASDSRVQLATERLLTA